MACQFIKYPGGQCPLSRFKLGHFKENKKKFPQHKPKIPKLEEIK
jgi:hypothetical protein